jgi:hypothetical protein
MATLPDFAAAWLAQRRTGAREIARMEAVALANLDAAEALRLSDALLGATPVTKTRGCSSGLVEQQALFARARR